MTWQAWVFLAGAVVLFIVNVGYELQVEDQERTIDLIIDEILSDDQVVELNRRLDAAER